MMRIYLALLFLLIPVAFADEDCQEPQSFGMGSLPMMEVVNAPGFFGCQRLATGESERIEYPRGTGPTGLGAGYRLSRPSADRYVVEIRLQFRRDADYSGKAKSDQELDADAKEELRSCLRWVNPGFKGPDGKSLEIRLSEDARVPLHTVPVGKSSFRANAEKYPDNIDCFTAVHEMLHLLGLVDEYKERFLKVSDVVMGMSKNSETASRTAYDCRTYGPDSSIMSSQLLAITEALDYDEYEVDECHCNDGIDCKVLGKGWDKPFCPPGSEKRRARYDWFRTQGLVQFQTHESFMLMPGNAKKTAEFGAKNGSILWPAQFRAITEPGCHDVNEKYYACARNAYRSSAGPGGYMMVFGGCLPVPEYCKTGDVDWLE